MSEGSELIYVKTNIAGYFFDAFLDMEHTSEMKITSHPVQQGANGQWSGCAWTPSPSAPVPPAAPASSQCTPCHKWY